MILNWLIDTRKKASECECILEAVNKANYERKIRRRSSLHVKKRKLDECIIHNETSDYDADTIVIDSDKNDVSGEGTIYIFIDYL